MKEIQTELINNGPVEAGIELFQDFAAYKRGVYTLTVNASYGGASPACHSYKSQLDE